MMKRLYKLVSVQNENDQYSIALDGRPVKTKSGVALTTPHQAVANIVMQEWLDQEETIIPDTMPFTQILSTLIDRVSKEREAMSAYILKYLDTDLLCYMADTPEDLSKIQEELWQPHRAWIEKKFNATLKVTTGLAALSQEPALHEKIENYVQSLDDEHFTLLQLVTSLSGSLILALAILDKETNAEKVFEAFFIEENYKDSLYDAQKHGQDPMIEKKKTLALRDLKAVELYLSFL